MGGRLHLCLSALCWCVGSALAADEAKPLPLRTKVWVIPNSGGYGQGQDLPRFADQKELLKESGIVLPPGGEATFDHVYDALTVRATDEVIEKVDAFLHRFDPAPPQRVRVTFTVVNFEAPDAQDLEHLTYDTARLRAGASWRLVDHSSLISRSGFVSTASRATEATPGGAKTTAASRKSPPDEMQIEPQFGEEKKELSLSFHYRRDVLDTSIPTRFDVEDKVSLKPGVPLLLRVVQLSAAGGVTRLRALIVEASVVDVPEHQGRQVKGGP